MSLLILDPGPLTTVQDLGRAGLGAFGVAPSGAMDPWALRLANLLTGSAESAAGLEFTLTGPTIAFEDDTVVALTGSRFEVGVLRSVTGSAFERDVDSRAAPHDESFVVHAGETLQMGKGLEGARGYLSVRGGIETTPILGSRSTHASSRLGGAPLKQGDRLRVSPAPETSLRRAISSRVYRSEQTLRAIAGPQQEAFAEGMLERFFSQPFRVTTNADRAGIRLEGETIALARAPDIDPEGVVTGAVQVPADGQPILLCNDRPATGGYAKIACVISADLSLAAHSKPGDTVRFARTTPADARDAWRSREEHLRTSIQELR
jgi:biotin-dependent carboxylase-like uncharacterized protein